MREPTEEGRARGVLLLLCQSRTKDALYLLRLCVLICYITVPLFYKFAILPERRLWIFFVGFLLGKSQLVQT